MIRKRPSGRMCKQPNPVNVFADAPAEPWATDVVGGVAHPLWPQSYIGTVRELLIALHRKVPHKHLVLTLWCDWGGMGTEALALKDMAS